MMNLPYFDGDYNLQGFSASLVEEQESCFVSKLKYSSLSEQQQQLEKMQQNTNEMDGSSDLVTIPAEDPREFGDRIAKFCGDATVYKMGSDKETTDVVPFNENARQVSIQFSKCFLFFFVARCFTTTITIPTGTTITFFWLFG